jgi:hypothetical protein
VAVRLRCGGGGENEWWWVSAVFCACNDRTNDLMTVENSR